MLHKRGLKRISIQGKGSYTGQASVSMPIASPLFYRQRSLDSESENDLPKVKWLGSAAGAWILVWHLIALFKFVYCSSSQSVVPRAIASLRNLLELQIFGYHPRHLNQRLCSGAQQVCILMGFLVILRLKVKKLWSRTYINFQSKVAFCIQL